MTRGDLALSVGALVAVALVGLGLVGPSEPAASQVPADAVAVVDGRVITVADYRRAIEAVAADSRNPVDKAVRERVLQRLIDEELLVQRGTQLDLARDDRVLRNALTNAVIDELVARGRARAGDPRDDELRRFYEAEIHRFSSPERLRVRQHLVGGGEPVTPLPDVLLPVGKLRDYLGASALAAVLGLEAGQSTAPIPTGAGDLVLTVVERRAGAPRPLASIRDQVRAEYRRSAGERSLRGYLDDQRRRVAIAIARERL